ncbi:hypothetical protein [Sinorhizobium sp. CCBAU 05631]|uniref:hypothetical protein n=1 Tax=Sinorhizobium sp. CCBAU 05631 TaxID=794846 RepID=UPI0004B4E07A|nr:hypothetical protein [Sinorhizobium sp. CCBAU 05631]ASY56862.1 Shufflon-specific DNA recombinase [Sinorhizobium sp. CCBAU 05631]
MSCNDIAAPRLPNSRKAFAGSSAGGKYISHLSSIFAIARPAWKIDLDYPAMEDAQVVLKRLGLVAKSSHAIAGRRSRSSHKLMEHYSDRASNFVEER